MNFDDLETLTREIEQYKSAGQHIELIRRMDQYDKETSDPIVKAILLTARATSSLNTDSTAEADEALARIDMASLTAGMQNYVNLVKAATAHQAGRLIEADRLLSAVLASPEIQDEELRDCRHEALARKGFVQADLNQFSAALDLLEMASALVRDSEWSENIDIYEGYCLQALGRLHEAEEILRRSLDRRPGDLKADAYYRLGAIELQKEEFAQAKTNFQNALKNMPCGRMRLEDIFSALRDAEEALTRPNLASTNRNSNP